MWAWSWRDLLRHPTRTALSLLGIAVATALLLDMVMLSGGIERSFGALLASRGFQLRVSPLGTLPFDTDATLDSVDGLLARARAEPGIVQAGAVLGTTAFAVTPQGRTPLVVYGVTPEVQGIYQMTSGHDLAPHDTMGLLVGAPSATVLGVQAGDSVRLVGRLDARLAAGAVTRTFAVRGIARFIYDARQQPSIAVTLATAQRLAGPGATDRASLLMLRAADSVSLRPLTARLRRDLTGTSVNDIGDMVAQFQRRLAYFRQLSLILGTISLIITVFLVGTLLAITVNERLGDIAALRAIGVARRTLVTQILTQGLLVTLVGAAAGVGLGVGTAQWLDAILTSFPGLPAAITFFVAAPAPLVRAAVLLVGAAIVSAAGPAWRAARAPIAATLRTDAL